MTKRPERIRLLAMLTNFGRDAHYLHADRYERADEFVDLVSALWDSWDDDAILRDTARLHVLDHRGTHFAVRGPLNISRPPQGRPMLVQAGASAAGRRPSGGWR